MAAYYLGVMGYISKIIYHSHVLLYMYIAVTLHAVWHVVYNICIMVFILIFYISVYNICLSYWLFLLGVCINVVSIFFAVFINNRILMLWYRKYDLHGSIYVSLFTTDPSSVTICAAKTSCCSQTSSPVLF